MSQPINFSELSFDQLPPEDRTSDPANQIYVSAVRQLETNQSSIGSKIALLGFSVFIFVALGRFAWDWNFVISLVPILFIHELGHWLAMKLFGYRNIKMFFIPLFGAAVSGRHYNIAAWKKAVVALAGPVPSIFLAIAIGVIAMIWRIDWIHPFIGLALVLNVMNLLPLLPLDGGWVAHIILFSRTMILSLLFRAFALVCMAIFAYLTGSYMLIAFSVFFALSLPVVFKQSKIVHRLKRESLPQPENDRIPASAIERILPEIQQEKIPSNNPQQYAQQIVEIYETVNTKPPGVWASLALLAIYSMSVLAPIAYGVVYVVRQGDPRQTLVDQQSATLEGDREKVLRPLRDKSEKDLLVWTFASEDEARTQMQHLQETQDTTVTRFGKTVLLTAHAITDADLSTDWNAEDPRLDRFITATPVSSSSHTGYNSAQMEFTVADQQVREIVVRQLKNIPAFTAASYFKGPWQAADPITPQCSRLRSLLNQGLSSDWLSEAEEAKFEFSAKSASEKTSWIDLIEARDEQIYLKRKQWLLDNLQQSNSEVEKQLLTSLLDYWKSKHDDDEFRSLQECLSSELRHELGELTPQDSEFATSLAMTTTVNENNRINCKLWKSPDPAAAIEAFTGWLTDNGVTNTELIWFTPIQGQ